MTSIIIPVFNQIAFTRRCIEALYATSSVQGGFEVLLVDDGSTDETPAFALELEGRHPNFRYLRNEVNLGFAATCNHGARMAGGESLVFLNNDTIPTAGWLAELVRALHEYPRAGLVGCKLLFPEETSGLQGYRVQHCGIVFGANKESKHLYKFCLAAQPFVDRRRELQAVTAASCIVRKDTFDRVGGFDVGYRNGGEDLDLCFKIRREGLKVWYCPTSIVIHHESVTVRSVGQAGHSSEDPNYKRFLSKWNAVIIDDETAAYRADGIRLPAKGAMRIAMASPLEPQKSGIADYVEELLPALSAHCRVDLFVDGFIPTNQDILAHHQVYRLEDLQWADWIHHYDQVVYHIGNNKLHEAIYRAARNHPGVAVLHEYDSKGCSTDRTNKELLQHLFDNAKGVIVHNDHSRGLLQPEFPHVPIEVIPHLLSPHSVRVDAERASAARHKLGIPEETFLIVSLGLVQEHKRSHIAVGAFAKFAQTCRNCLLVLGGDIPDPGFKNRLQSLAASRGLKESVRVTGWLPEEEFFDWLAAADVTINLRYPSRGEESGSLTRTLGSGKPAIVSNYAQYADLPDDIVLKVGFQNEENDLATVLGRFYAEPDLRKRFADAACTYVTEHNALERVATLYAGFCARTASRTAGRCFGYTAGAEAGVLFQAPVWDHRSPYRELIFGLDRLGVPMRVEAAFLSEELTSGLGDRSRQRIHELEETPVGKNHVQVYAGPVESFERHPDARTTIVLLGHSEASSCSTLIQQGADHFIVPSLFSRSRLERAGVPADRISVVPHGVSALLYGTTIRGGIPPETVKFLCMIDPSRDSRWQQVALAFLQEFRGRNDVSLHFKLLSRDVDPVDNLRQINTLWWEFSQKHPEFRPEEYRSILTDQRDLPEDEMPFYYCGFNCYIFPRTDASFGRSVLETMAIGLPVIASRTGGHAEIVGEGDALLFGGSTELKQCMRKIVDEPALRQAKGIAARYHILSRWTSHHAASRMLEELETLSKSSLVSARTTILAPVAGKGVDSASETRAIRDNDVFVFESSAEEKSGSAATLPAQEVPPVLWNAPFGNPSGYTSEALNFVLPLAGLPNFAIASRGEVSHAFTSELPPEVRQTLASLERTNVPRGEYIGIQHFPASGFRYDPNAAYRIGRTMFETDRLPGAWVELCNMMDEVWVPTDFNMNTFASSGVAKEKLVKIPGAIDVHLFDPDTQEPLDLQGKKGFNFLSVFEWLERKGWETLLAAYFEAFSSQDDVCLFLRTYLLGRHDRKDAENIYRRVRGYAKRIGHDLSKLPSVVVIDKQIPFSQLPRLYRAVDAFVLPSRGEGWGRPYMEAMAMGLPTIGTAWSGNTEFMDEENSYLIAVDRLTSIERMEHTHYLGHNWAEPSRSHLMTLMRKVFEHREEGHQVGGQARRDIVARYSREHVAPMIMERLQALRPTVASRIRPVAATQERITWEGPIFSSQSLAVVNRELCTRLIKGGYNTALIPSQEDRTSMHQPSSYPILRDRAFTSASDSAIHVRHLWPANLNPPKSGRWVVIQPWEFGSLPRTWVETFSTVVDELWVPSTFVRQEFIESGVPAERVFVVPNGVDPAKFHPGAEPYPLRTKKRFRYLFVGGTILRKGIDLLLHAYVTSFKRSDDVCLVVKDMGGNSFYGGQTCKPQILELANRPDLPEIEYLENVIPEKEMPGLYAACNVLVHPYRGEGFGLPILEAMACGLPAIVTNGGASLDFCNGENSLLVNARKTTLDQRVVGGEELVGNVWFHEPDVRDLQAKMVEAFRNESLLRGLGKRAAHDAASLWTWDRAYDVVRQRIEILKDRPIVRSSRREQPSGSTPDAIRAIVDRFNMGKYEEVQVLIKRIQEELRLQPGSQENVLLLAELSLLEGAVWRALGDRESARKVFEAALTLVPTLSRACQAIGELFMEEEAASDAKTMLEWAVKNDPANTGAIAELAQVNLLLGKPPNHTSLAEEDEVHQMDADRLLTRAEELLAQGDINGALALIDNAEESLQSSGNPTDQSRVGFDLLRGNAHLARKDAPSAKACFERALHADPNSSGACIGLGEVFSLQGRTEAAKMMYEWGLKNDPASRAAVSGLTNANRNLGLPLEENSLVKQEALPPAPDDERNVTAVRTESAFARAIDLLFSKVRPQKIIETGTYLGTGTTTIIASAIRQYGIDNAVFYTIEVNPGLHRQAKMNLEQCDLLRYVFPLNGLSVPRGLLPSFQDIEQRCVRDAETQGLYVDHDLDVRAQRYFGETDHAAVPDDLLGGCLKEFDDRPDFVLLDSGGHMGLIEFNYVIDRLKGPCFISLDDIYHIKHNKSFLQMQKDPRFEILIAEREKTGFCIARFVPDTQLVHSTPGGLNLNTFLASAYEAFERKDYAKALSTIVDAEQYLDAAGARVGRAEAKGSFENLKGLNYLGMNKLEEARASFEAALHADPVSSQACAGLGEVFYLAGMDSEAKIMYEQAVKHGPNNHFGIAGLAKVNRLLGLPESHTTLS